MKKIYFIFSALLMAMLTSCSSGDGVKKITPTYTEFASGKLARYVEVVDKSSELRLSEDSVNLLLKVTLRMKKDGFKNVEAQDIDFTDDDGARLILVDENGSTLDYCYIKEGEILKLKKLLTGSKGETTEIIFESWSYNHTPEFFKRANQFTPDETCDISVEVSSFDEKESDEAIETSEETSNGIFSDTDTPDWNELLDSYEQYVDKYLSYVKKAANGDMDALAEYPSLMQKAQEFSEKMEGAQSNMSASQWSRYMKITNKMIEAAQELQ